MNSFEVVTGKATAKDVQQHLERCSEDFKPPLHSYVDICEYSEKIVNNAETFEVWYENKLVALVAVYLNDPEKLNAYITNVSVEKKFQGKGLANILLDNIINKSIALNFKFISLRVRSDNQRAIGIYSLKGFSVVRKDSDKFIEMKKVL
jgi:ribosomal protein S18 acetylase RimI-like enzyme